MNLMVALRMAGLAVALGAASTIQAIGQGATASPGNSGHETPIIQFETNFFDFGKLNVPGAVSGVFKFKNDGNGVLVVGPPKPSCGCTDARVTPSKVVPGGGGEISYTINLDHVMGQVQKHITVNSNDPKTPSVDLTIQLDYTPLYELTPLVLRTVLPADQEEARGNFTIVRNDGKPLGLSKLVASQKWVHAELAPSFTPEASSAQINVTVHRPPSPLALMMANVQLWATNLPDRPVQTLFLSCAVQGELSATPPQLYWVIPNFGDSLTNYPASCLSRTVKLESILKKPVDIENVTTSIQGLEARVSPREAGKGFDLTLKFSKLPEEFTSGNVTIATASPSLPKLNVPVTVSVAPR
jgi:hypothetical protein